MLRILIADDHDGVRHALKRMLLEEFPAVFIEEAEDTRVLISKANSEEWDIVISDLVMPGGGGFTALKSLKITRPGLPIIIFSTYPPEQYGDRVVSAGAAAFVSKDAPPAKLVQVVRQILDAQSTN